VSTSTGGRVSAARAASARPTPRPAPRTGRRSSLTVVPDRRSAPGRAFVVLLLAVLGAGLVGLLVLNTAMQRAAFTLDALDQKATALDVRRQVLDLKVDRLQSPQVLGRRATELGMVPMTTPVFLRLSGGKILGDPQPAVAGTGPQLIAPPPAPPHAAPPAGGQQQPPHGQQGQQGQQGQGQQGQQGQGQQGQQQNQQQGRQGQQHGARR